MNVEVFLQNDLNFNSPNQQTFQDWTNMTLAHVPNHIAKNIKELCIRIVNEEESARLNETFRHKKGPTNVLSFETLGDLAICGDIVEKEAKSQHKDIEAHWAHLTVHGILHLAGYDHEKEEDAKKMEDLEIKILKKLGYGNPYLEESFTHE